MSEAGSESFRRSLTPVSSFGSSPTKSSPAADSPARAPAAAAATTTAKQAPATPAIAKPAAAGGIKPRRNTVEDVASLTPAAKAAYATRMRLKQTVAEYRLALGDTPPSLRRKSRAPSSTTKQGPPEPTPKKLLMPIPPPAVTRPATAATKQTVASSSTPARAASARPKPVSALLFTPRNSITRRRPSRSPSLEGSTGRPSIGPQDPYAVPAPPAAPWTGPTAIPEYNSLRDASLGHFFAKPATRQLLLRAGVIAEDGRIVQLNRAFGRVVVAERNFVLAEHDEQQRQDEAAFLKSKLRHRVDMTRQQQNRVQRVQALRSADLARLKSRHEEQVELMKRCGIDVVRDETEEGDALASDEAAPAAAEKSQHSAFQPSDEPPRAKDDDEERSPLSTRSSSSSSSPRSKSPSRTPSRTPSQSHNDDDYGSDEFDSPVASPHLTTILRHGGRYIFARSAASAADDIEVLAPLRSPTAGDAAATVENGMLVAWQAATSAAGIEFAIWEASVSGEEGVVTLSLGDVDVPEHFNGRPPALCSGESHGADVVIGPLATTTHFQFKEERVSEFEMANLSERTDAVSLLPRGRFDTSAGLRLVNVQSSKAAIGPFTVYTLD